MCPVWPDTLAAAPCADDLAMWTEVLKGAAPEIDRRLKAKATKARQANSRAKRIAKIEIETLPQSSRRYPKFRFPENGTQVGVPIWTRVWAQFWVTKFLCEMDL